MKLEKIKTDIDNIDKTIEKFKIELENIEGALLNDIDSHESKKKYMRDLVNKTENLHLSSVNLQEKMSEERTTLAKKQEQLDLISRRITDSKLSDRPKLIEEKCKIELELSELNENIEELEAQYGVTLEELTIATAAINKIEDEILAMRDLSEKSLKSSKKQHKKDSSFSMDTDTKQFLTGRKEEIIQEIPELKQKKQQLCRELDHLINTQSSMMLELRDLEREIMEITRQTGDCEDFLSKIATPSPLRNRAM